MSMPERVTAYNTWKLLKHTLFIRLLLKNMNHGPTRQVMQYEYEVLRAEIKETKPAIFYRLTKKLGGDDGPLTMLEYERYSQRAHSELQRIVREVLAAAPLRIDVLIETLQQFGCNLDNEMEVLQCLGAVSETAPNVKHVKLHCINGGVYLVPDGVNVDVKTGVVSAC